MKYLASIVFAILLVQAFVSAQPNQQWPYTFNYSIDNGTNVVEHGALLWIGDTLKPVRGIIITSMTRNEVEFTRDPEIREAMREEQLAHLFLYRERQGDHFYGGPIGTFNITLQHDTLLMYILRNFALITGKPEIEHAPWMTFGHSTSGIFAKNMAWWKPGRMFGVIFYKTGGYQPPDWLDEPDTTAFLNIPWLSVAARIDRYGPGEDGWRIMRSEMMPWRKLGGLMSQIVEPTWEEGHSYWRSFNAPYFAHFIREAARARIPSDTIARYGPIPLLNVDPAIGVLSDTIISALIDQPEISERLLRFYYDTKPEDQGKMFWHFNIESAIKWVNYHHVHFDEFIPERDTIIQGKINYWNKNIPLGPGASGIFETASIKGVDNSGYVSGQSTTVADDNGFFTLNSHDRVVEMEYDMKGDYHHPHILENIMHYINGMDAWYLERIIENDVDFQPNIFQIWSADVNMDGAVDSIDLVQLIDRALGIIPEFHQKWNYDGETTPVINKPSHDWLFYENSRTRFNVYTRISDEYPGDDGIGYSKHRIPEISNKTIPPYDIGNPYPKYKEALFKGVMVGDLDGSFVNDTDIMSTDHMLQVSFSAETKQSESPTELSVSILSESNKPVYATDIFMVLSPEDYRFVDIRNEQGIKLHHHISGNQVHLISWNHHEIKKDTLLITMIIEGESFSSENIQTIVSYMNGMRSGIDILNTTNVSSMDQVLKRPIIFPLPANDMIYVIIPEVQSHTMTYCLYDMYGRQIKMNQACHSGNKQFSVSLSGLKAGLYIIKIHAGQHEYAELIMVNQQTYK